MRFVYLTHQKSHDRADGNRKCLYNCIFIVKTLDVCVASQSSLFHKVHFYQFKNKSDSTACISYLVWNRVPCSCGSMLYCAPPLVCSGLGDCEEPSGGISCGVCMGVGCLPTLYLRVVG